MAHIIEIRVRTIIPTMRGPYWTSKTFKTFTDDNGNNRYFIGEKEVSKEDGNREYLNLRKANEEWTHSCDCKDFIKNQWRQYYRLRNRGWAQSKFTLHEADTFIQETSERDVTYEELIEGLEKSIDQYVEYIDDYKQYESALKANERIREHISALKELIAQRTA